MYIVEMAGGKKRIAERGQMVREISKKSKIRNKILIIFAIVLAAIIIVLGFFWNKYLNKNNLIGKFETPQNQEVYLLGTFHKDHFNKWLNYSMEDVISVVRNVQPDVVFIEAREDYFEEYGAVDGPIDMTVIYSYCMNNDIPVEMIDWWVVDNDFQSNTTNAKRDDMIFTNIDSKLKEVGNDTKVLVVCGAGHFYEQSNRFQNNGIEKKKIKNKAAYFDSKNIKFEYPAGTEAFWEKRVYFYAYTFPEIVGQDETLNDEIKSQFTGGNQDSFYNQQLKYCELFLNDELYE